MRVRTVGMSMVAATMAVAMAAPAWAAGVVRMVDDDGRASPGDCAGTASARTSIQKAVDASGPNDIVVVCPGVYRQRVTIGAAKDGLEIRSTKTHAAVVRSPASMTSSDAVIRIAPGAANVTLSRLAVRHVAPLVSTAGGVDCAIGEGVLVGGVNALLTGLKVFAEGAGTLGDCAMRIGIMVTGEGTQSATVEDSLVKDFRSQGIAGNGTGTTLAARRNIVRFHHLTSPETGATGRGIVIDDGAGGTIRANLVESHPSVDPLGPSPEVHLSSAIDIQVWAATVSVRDNTVRRAFNAIRLTNGPEAAEQASASVTGNAASQSYNGIFVDGGSPLVRGNTLTSDRYGLWAWAPAADASFEDNVATDSVAGDCTDQTTGTGTAGTANTWTGNTGTTASPAGICSA